MGFELMGKNGSAGMHAMKKHRCRFCGKVCKGNGGISSHERACNPKEYYRQRAENRRVFDEAYRIAALAALNPTGDSDGR